MEASLFLCYCGGMYHFMRWAGEGRSGSSTQIPNPRGGSTGHAVAVGLYFVLGFMTKFVAALFLPVVLLAAALTAPEWRRRLFAQWTTWLAVTALVVLLSAPWFVWAHLTYGPFVWEMMFGAHVVTRFTAYLDPAHVQPWYFYPVQLYTELRASGTALFGIAGLVVLLVQTIRRRWADGLLVLLWLCLPVAAISLGTSKLYHYLYPFLPPVALAGGYAVALALAVLPAPIIRRLRHQSWLTSSRLEAISARPVVRATFLSLASAAIAVAIASLVFGPLRFEVPGIGPVRSSGIFRPIVVAVLFGILGGAIRRVTHAVIVVLVISLLPLPAYRRSLVRLTEGQERLRDARDCLLAIQDEVSGPGLYVDAPPPAISHPVYYYLRRVRPWTRAETPRFELLDQYLHDPAAFRPILVWEPTYQAFWYGTGAELVSGPPSSRHPSPSMLVFEDVGSNTFLLLPGPYAACGAEAQSR
jgi:4-amino-4-deoxy-L-arabinose transferase-like glycosyltransferase